MVRHHKDKPDKLRAEAFFFGEPWPRRGRKKGQTDSTTAAKFVRMVKMLKEGRSWPRIEETINVEFGQHRGRGTHKQLFKHHLPTYLKWYREHFRPDMSETELLAIARQTVKRRAGRPKKSKD